MASAARDLPLAVGPAISTAGFSPSKADPVVAMAGTVLVLIAAPGSRAIDGEALAILEQAGFGAPVWLAEAEACEFALEGPVPAGCEEELRGTLAPRPIDVALVDAAGRRKRLLLADMDSTMIRQECVDELAQLAGVSDEVKAITARGDAGRDRFRGIADRGAWPC